MERVLRFGVVGCGRIAGNHLRALASGHVPMLGRPTEVAAVIVEAANQAGR